MLRKLLIIHTAVPPRHLSRITNIGAAENIIFPFCVVPIMLLIIRLFEILTNINTLLCSSGKKTLEQREKTANALEEFGLYFPVNYRRNLTRKMHLLAFSAPKQIREHGDWYRYLRLEQETERAHHELNLLEEEFRSVKNKAQNFFLMLKAFKNKQKIDKSVALPRKRVN